MVNLNVGTFFRIWSILLAYQIKVCSFHTHPPPHKWTKSCIYHCWNYISLYFSLLFQILSHHGKLSCNTDRPFSFHLHYRKASAPISLVFLIQIRQASRLTYDKSWQNRFCYVCQRPGHRHSTMSKNVIPHRPYLSELLVIFNWHLHLTFWMYILLLSLYLHMNTKKTIFCTVLKHIFLLFKKAVLLKLRTSFIPLCVILWVLS